MPNKFRAGVRKPANILQSGSSDQSRFDSAHPGKSPGSKPSINARSEIAFMDFEVWYLINIKFKNRGQGRAQAIAMLGIDHRLEDRLHMPSTISPLVMKPCQ